MRGYAYHRDTMDVSDVAARYLRFAEMEARERSPLYAEISRGIAADREVLGFLLTLAPVVLYRSYAAAVRPEGLSALDDQAWGGVVMWGLGGLIDVHEGHDASGRFRLTTGCPPLATVYQKRYSRQQNP